MDTTAKLMMKAMREANRKGIDPRDNQPAYAREYERTWKREAGLAARRAADLQAAKEELQAVMKELTEWDLIN
jgi:hypothetical protein